MSRRPPLLWRLAILGTLTFTSPVIAGPLEGTPAGRLPCWDPASAGLPADVYPGRVTAHDEPGLLPPVPAHPLGTPSPPPPWDAGRTADPAARNQPAPAVEDQVEYYTLDELKAEMKKLAWTKGPFTVVPYGILWFDMAWESQRTNNGGYTLYVFSPDDRPGDAFQVNARSTRLGLSISGPRVPCLGCARSGGKVEIDFWGQFAADDNEPGVLLRQAYWEVKDDTFRLLAGETWDVISPLSPGTLLYTLGWGGGYHRPQLRYERYLTFSNTLLLTAEGALAADPFSELPPSVASDPAGWPVLQGRVGMTLGHRGPFSRPITFGVSGHVGEQEFLFHTPDPAADVIARTWSLNVDVRVPITDRLGVQGELFTGENLGAYMNGVLQGINRATGDPIRARGGWLEVWYDWTPLVHSRAGYLIDDPTDRDLDDGRTYNDFLFANIAYDLTKNSLVGLEYTSWKTLYDQRTDGLSDRFALVAQYGF